MNSKNRTKSVVTMSKISRQWKWLQQSKEKNVRGALILRP